MFQPLTLSETRSKLLAYSCYC